MATTGTPKSAGRRHGLHGPVPTDIGELTRDRTWAWVVRQCDRHGKSWDKLDDYWLAWIDEGKKVDADEDQTTEKVKYRNRRTKQGEVGPPRRRVFHQIFYVGHDPASTLGKTKVYLLDAVRSDPKHADATDLYDSLFWEVVGARAPTIERLRQIHRLLMERLGFICLTSTEIQVARETGYASLVEEEETATVRRCVSFLTECASVDAIALLGCSYLLAMDRLALREADIYLSALPWALHFFQIRWSAPRLVVMALRGLVEVRIVRRPDVPVPPELLGFKKPPSKAKTRQNAVRLRRSDVDRMTHEPYVARMHPIEEVANFLLVYPELYKQHRARIIQELEAPRAEDSVSADPMSKDELELILFHSLGEFVARPEYGDPEAWKGCFNHGV